MKIWYEKIWDWTDLRDHWVIVVSWLNRRDRSLFLETLYMGRPLMCPWILDLWLNLGRLVTKFRSNGMFCYSSKGRRRLYLWFACLFNTYCGVLCELNVLVTSDCANNILLLESINAPTPSPLHVHVKAWVCLWSKSMRKIVFQR